jgi:L-threonylcarbamoyladenylate synthase
LVVDIVPAGAAMARALELLAAEEPVGIPTETVYGLAADATSGAAVARIYAAKGRPSFNPLIAHVASPDMAEANAVFDPLSRRLAERFWPGPLTLVLPLREGSPIHPLATAGLDTVGLRMPAGFAADLIARFGRPLAAPSANRSGAVTGTTAQAVATDLEGRIRLVVDGGPSRVGVESTIVKVEDGRLRLLRPGGLAAEDIEAVAGIALSRDEARGVEAPGMLASHYAPTARVRPNAFEVRPGESLLAFGPARIAGAGQALAVANLSGSGDLAEAAANLFGHLRALDRAGATAIAVEPIPEHGLGEAINDRLRRAAAPRPASSEPPST